DDDDRAPIGRGCPGARAAEAFRLPLRGREARVVTRQPASRQRLPDRGAGDAQHLAIAGVALNEHPDRVSVGAERHVAGSRPDPSLEAEALHAGAPANTALGHRYWLRRLDGRTGGLGPNVE